MKGQCFDTMMMSADGPGKIAEIKRSTNFTFPSFIRDLLFFERRRRSVFFKLDDLWPLSSIDKIRSRIIPQISSWARFVITKPFWRWMTSTSSPPCVGKREYKFKRITRAERKFTKYINCRTKFYATIYDIFFQREKYKLDSEYEYNPFEYVLLKEFQTNHLNSKSERILISFLHFVFQDFFGTEKTRITNVRFWRRRTVICLENARTS